MRFLHFSDIHVWSLSIGGDYYPKRLLGLANLMLRRGRKFPESVARRFIERLAAEEADAVFFTGDLTSTSSQREFEKGREIFQPVMEKWGDRFLAIPGNHDRYSPGAIVERRFERIFLQHEQRYPFVKRFDSNISIVGIDVSEPHLITARGRVTNETLSSLSAELHGETQEGRAVIVLGHYPFLNVYPGGIHSPWQHRLIGMGRLRHLVDRKPVIAYLHGHWHQRWALSLEHCLCLNAGSAGRIGRNNGREPGYLRIDVENQTVSKVTAVFLMPHEYEQWGEKTIYSQNMNL